jgi:RNA polymerase sigma-70 factor (ECF subfamily)
LRRRLTRAIDALPDDLRVVFVMHYVEGYRHHEIADALGIREGASRTRLSRARQRLRRVLGDETDEANR